MKNKTYLGGILAIALLMVVGLACNGNGTKLEFNGGELYYTDNVTESEAKKLGEYLVKEGFYDGKPKSVQLDKEGSNYQFRMVVQKEKQNDPQTLDMMKTFGKELSADVFNNAPVEMHVCDETLKTLSVVKP
jgi:hypothetical protein